MGLREEILQIASEGRTALVIGLGVSGIASIKFLLSLRLRVIAFEKQSKDTYCHEVEIAKEIRNLQKDGVEVFFGVDTPTSCPEIDDVGICVISPGVSTKHPLVKLLKGRGVPCIGELELGMMLANRRSIVVTGSNGKSTTVTLIHEMLKSSGVKSFLCGNVGTPIVSVLEKEGIPSERKINEVLVVEASSYQLETCTILKPDIGVFLNLSENHLERHGSLEEYAAAKKKLFAKQTSSDVAILNDDDSWSRSVKDQIKSKTLLFGMNVNCENCAKIIYSSETNEDRIELSLGDSSFSVELYKSHLKGLHNRYNIAAAMLAALFGGANKEGIVYAIENFRSLEHRFEVLNGTGDLTVINDSKSTTVASTISAVDTVLNSYGKLPVVIMVGGQAKKNSWDPLGKILINDRILSVICFGKDGRRIAEALPNKELAISVADTLKKGVELAIKKSLKSGVILFSPACASFDEFRDFEDRGMKFKAYIHEEMMKRML